MIISATQARDLSNEPNPNVMNKLHEIELKIKEHCSLGYRSLVIDSMKHISPSENYNNELLIRILKGLGYNVKDYNQKLYIDWNYSNPPGNE